MVFNGSEASGLYLQAVEHLMYSWAVHIYIYIYTYTQSFEAKRDQACHVIATMTSMEGWSRYFEDVSHFLEGAERQYCKSISVTSIISESQ